MFATLYIIFIQIDNHIEDVQNQTTKFHMATTHIFFDDTLDFFIKNPDMNYYYENIFNNKKIPYNTTRNLIKEQIISFMIMSRLANFAIFFNYHIGMQIYSEIVTQECYRIVRIFNNFLKSPIFRGYVDEYLNKYEGFGNQKFLKEFFDIVASKPTNNYQKIIANSNIVDGKLIKITNEEQKKNPIRSYTWKVIYDPNQKII